MQVRELREYAVRRGWNVSAEDVDTAWSGAKASRPELDRLMKTLHYAGVTLSSCGSWTALADLFAIAWTG